RRHTRSKRDWSSDVCSSDLPAIRKEIIQQRDTYVEKGVKCVVVDIPLLYESNLIEYVDKVLVVYVDEAVQLQRVVSRDNSTEEEAKQRINSQIPVAEIAKKADEVIDNNRTVEQSYHQLDEILIKWQIK